MSENIHSAKDNSYIVYKYRNVTCVIGPPHLYSGGLLTEMSVLLFFYVNLFVFLMLPAVYVKIHTFKCAVSMARPGSNWLQSSLQLN